MQSDMKVMFAWLAARLVQLAWNAVNGLFHLRLGLQESAVLLGQYLGIEI